MAEFGRQEKVSADVVKISCIIPTLNRQKVLANTINDLLQQTTLPHEIIVVDQTVYQHESEKKLFLQFSDHHLLRWIFQSEQNASLARNVGTLASTGDIVLFLDDDVKIGPYFIAAHSRNYLDPRIIAVSGQILEMEQEVVEQLPSRALDPEVGWLYFPKNYAKRCQTSWMASGNFSIRKQHFIDLGGMDANYRRGAFREESDFAMRFRLAGHRFQFDPEASLVHLGIRVVEGGGARSWSRVFMWHHYIGDWYFNLRWWNMDNIQSLFWFSFRFLVASRYNIYRPWLLPVCFSCWLLTLPIALYLRHRNPKLISYNFHNEC